MLKIIANNVIKFIEDKTPFVMFVLNILCAICYNYEYYLVFNSDYDAFISEGFYPAYEYYFGDLFGSSILVCTTLIIIYWKRKYCITTIITLSCIIVLHTYNLIAIKLMFYAPVYDLFIIFLFTIILLVYYLQTCGVFKHKI